MFPAGAVIGLIMLVRALSNQNGQGGQAPSLYAEREFTLSGMGLLWRFLVPGGLLLAAAVISAHVWRDVSSNVWLLLLVGFAPAFMMAEAVAIPFGLPRFASWWGNWTFIDAGYHVNNGSAWGVVASLMAYCRLAARRPLSEADEKRVRRLAEQLDLMEPHAPARNLAKALVLKLRGQDAAATHALANVYLLADMPGSRRARRLACEWLMADALSEGRYVEALSCSVQAGALLSRRSLFLCTVARCGCAPETVSRARLVWRWLFSLRWVRHGPLLRWAWRALHEARIAQRQQAEWSLLEAQRALDEQPGAYGPGSIGAVFNGWLGVEGATKQQEQNTSVAAPIFEGNWDKAVLAQRCLMSGLQPDVDPSVKSWFVNASSLRAQEQLQALEEHLQAWAEQLEGAHAQQLEKGRHGETWVDPDRLIADYLHARRLWADIVILNQEQWELTADVIVPLVHNVGYQLSRLWPYSGLHPALVHSLLAWAAHLHGARNTRDDQRMLVSNARAFGTVGQKLAMLWRSEVSLSNWHAAARAWWRPCLLAAGLGSAIGWAARPAEYPWWSGIALGGVALMWTWVALTAWRYSGHWLSLLPSWAGLASAALVGASGGYTAMTLSLCVSIAAAMPMVAHKWLAKRVQHVSYFDVNVVWALALGSSGVPLVLGFGLNVWWLRFARRRAEASEKWARWGETAYAWPWAVSLIVFTGFFRLIEEFVRWRLMTHFK